MATDKALSTNEEALRQALVSAQLEFFINIMVMHQDSVGLRKAENAIWQTKAEAQHIGIMASASLCTSISTLYGTR